MSCFPCFSKSKSKSRENSRSNSFNEDVVVAAAPKPHEIPSSDADKKEGSGNIAAQSFTFRELASATRNFRPDCLLGEGGFGRVYKGVIESTGQDVAIKQLDRNGMQGNKEFLTEVLTLSLLHHTNLVNLIGYCADGDQRLLVYEFMSLGSLDKHLFDLPPDRKPLSWYTRMKIATGAATGLEYLHDKANPPIIYRDLKSANILLNEEHTAKISDFGLAKLGLMGDSNLHAASMVMGTYGYCAPEYAKSGELTLKSDVYSFGVLMLELITGRRAMDPTKPANEQNLVAWAQPMFKDQKRFPELVDPLLGLNYPARDLNQAVAVAAMCLQEESMVRPLMADVVMTLSFLQCQPPASVPAAPAPKKTKSSSSSSSDSSGDEEKKRKKAVAMAIEWGSMEREQQRSQQEDGSESESESESEAGEEEEAESE